MTHHLTHHFLVPTATMSDKRFANALIYVCRHSKNGAWGFIVNQAHPVLAVDMLLSELGLAMTTKPKLDTVLHGGFIRPEAGFVLHTGQGNFDVSSFVGDNVFLSTSKDVLQWIGAGGLEHYLICMGFCQWGKGQLEKEMLAKDWQACPADAFTLFGCPLDQRLSRIRQKIALFEPMGTA